VRRRRQWLAAGNAAHPLPSRAQPGARAPHAFSSPAARRRARTQPAARDLCGDTGSASDDCRRDRSRRRHGVPGGERGAGGHTLRPRRSLSRPAHPAGPGAVAAAHHDPEQSGSQRGEAAAAAAPPHLSAAPARHQGTGVMALYGWPMGADPEPRFPRL
ncbi:MAG: FIG00636577: hypothetical protein, partial [uncultured Sphingosinicella sp.]